MITAERRREVGSASARSLLLTVLGEFVHPRGSSVWTGTLVEALAALGIEEKSARQALSRSASEGLLTSTRHGRRVRWSLSPSGEHLLQEGTARIYGFQRTYHPWDGRWLILTVAIPESQRRLRHRLRTRLTWLGLGTPAPGLWIVPDATKLDDVREVVEDLELTGRVFAWVGPATDLGDQGRLLADAWALDDVAGRYRDFIAAFGDREADKGRDVFVAQAQLVQAWRRFPFIDPDLPATLLAHDWPGRRAAEVFHGCYARWHRHAQDEWDRMDTDSGRRT